MNKIVKSLTVEPNKSKQEYLDGDHFLNFNFTRLIACTHESRRCLSFGNMWRPFREQKGTQHVISGIFIILLSNCQTPQCLTMETMRTIISEAIQLERPTRQQCLL